MADGDKTTNSGTAEKNPESPTTARPLDFDDEQESGATAAATPTAAAVNKPLPALAPGDEGTPPKPPRPLSPHHQAERELKEAFPNIEATVIKAVLVASGGNLERAFHALLGMSDPDAQVDDIPPAKPPRPTVATSTSQQQLEQDELYARQLAEHYNASTQRRRPAQSAHSHEPRLPRPPRKEMGLKPNELYDDDEREHSFLEDDLPVIKESFRQGFLETQSKVNSWVQNLMKKIDGEESEDEYADRPAGYPQGFADTPNTRPRRSGEARRSAERERYDADPQILSDNFTSLELRDNEAPPARPPRPLANTGAFKTKSASPDRRKVSFQEGPPEEIKDHYSGANKSSTPAAKSSKWQPLSAVDPSPIGDNDPFSLGDSDDEREAKNKDMKPDEAERVRKATEEAMSGEIGSSPKPDATPGKPAET